jgi:3-oxoacyl-[acyl-carrier protein] reductase
MHPDIESSFSLSGRCCVITGAASGIGREIAITFSKAGADVMLADVDAAGLAETARLAEAVGAKVVPVVTDVTRRSEVEALIAAALEHFARLDVLANVAGIIRNSAVVDTSEADLDAVLAVNLKGVFFGCAAAARVMAERGGGSIINLASAGMDMPAPGLASYAMSKAAVAMLTRTLAVEIGARGVRVNTIAPGFIDTPMTSRHFTGPDGAIDERVRDELWHTRAAQTPLGEIGRPADIALAALYLASDAARFVTGQVLRPNGGVAMP